jgi:putative sigma-54 modulation protein
MKTSVTFKNIEPSEPLKSYVSDKLDRFDRFLDSPAEANVVLQVEKFRHIAEININGRKFNIIAKEETNDMYSAIDMALDKISKQIRKNKEKIKDRRNTTKKSLMPDELTEIEEIQKPQVMVQNIEYKPMDIDEAIMQMDLITDNFLVFSNAKTDQINVLYRRKDGNFGLIQPSNR